MLVAASKFGTRENPSSQQLLTIARDETHVIIAPITIHDRRVACLSPRYPLKGARNR